MVEETFFKKNLITILGKKFVPLIKYRDIHKRVKEISEQIKKDYSKTFPVFVVVLKGAIFFASELLKNIDIPIRVETLKAKSYGTGMQSSGKVELFLTCEEFAGMDLIVVEDIIDTGLTITTILKELEKFQPKSIEVATLLLKPKNLMVNLKVKYCGFEIPEHFVIGFGLDYAEYGRNLKDIYILQQ